jgi:hypothetical protein
VVEVQVKIADFSLAMQASHEWSQQSSVQENLRVWVDAPNNAASHRRQTVSPAAVQVSISDAAKHRQASEAAAAGSTAQNVANDPKLQLIILMIEKITGHKIRIFDASQLAAPQTTQAPAQAPDPNAAQQGPPPRAGFGVDYSKVTNYSESEQTTLQASGVIHTTDGKEIQFNLNLAMQRQYSETSSTSVQLGDAARKKTDPLVINFNGTAAQLTDQRFAFDLNSDGTNEQINFTQPGSGFLALDKNGDGKINSGSELFGPNTGNGFSELAQYDSDHNGWIDENDAVFNQLKVWTKDASGGDQLNSLASLGVGAISLQSISTPFDIKTASNQLLGSVIASSVALNENGSVGSVQQIDLTA